MLIQLAKQIIILILALMECAMTNETKNDNKTNIYKLSFLLTIYPLDFKYF